MIDRGWRTYLDRKVVHFAYFYVLWVTIQFGFKAPAFAAETSWTHAGPLYLVSFIDPFGTLWFIYLLPIFFVVIKATRRTPPAAVWAVAALLEMTHLATGWTVIDEFCARFVYIYSGYLFAGHVFALSDRARARPGRALADWRSGRLSMAAWWRRASANGRWSRWRSGFSGACAIITTGTLLARMNWLNCLRVCGEHSIVIYLAFFLPMAATRTLLLHAGLIRDIGTISLLVTIVGVLGALAMWRMALAVGANFLFERPAAFWLAPQKPRRPALQAAA